MVERFDMGDVTPIFLGISEDITPEDLAFPKELLFQPEVRESSSWFCSQGCRTSGRRWF